jgi:ABC-type polysaccharide/polyol phosphate export permease
VRVVASFRGLWRVRELLLLLVHRDLKVRYKRSILGMTWTLLNPLMQMGVYTLVFSTIMRVDLPAFSLFLLAGLLPWTLVSISITSAAHALLANQDLIRKVAVPQMVYPLALVGSKLVDMLLSLVPLALLALLLGRPPSVAWVFLPVALLVLVVFASGLALLFSSLTVFYRDVRHLSDVLVQVWFYLTPVLYPVSYLEKLPYEWLQTVFRFNPATPVIQLFHFALYERAFPDVDVVLRAGVSALAAAALGLAVFLHNEHDHIHSL